MSRDPARPFRLATRSSPLARWQADWVAAHLDTPVEMVFVDTAGDRRQDVPLSAIGGQGVFVKEVQQAVLDGRADAAVHSAKDLPSVTAAGLDLAAIGQRDDPRDALVGSTLSGLAPGATVATGSVRRRAQLGALRPDLVFAELRGNMGTRLAKAAGFDAIVVAVAALRRLGLEERIAEALDVDTMIPQVGQGAVAVECRAGDAVAVQVLAAVDDRRTHRAVSAERAFLAVLGSGCTLPVGGHATVGDDDALSLHAVIASLDGATSLRHRASGSDPVALGEAVGHHLLDVMGGRDLLGSSA
ncbi:MAG: hydroxymethylbilane synthase [Acidimicrobiales bacterium]